METTVLVRAVLRALEQRDLPWLQAGKKNYRSYLTAVEVATGKQVEDALHFDVDILWIGARTTVNPFSVQDVADALPRLKGSGTY